MKDIYKQYKIKRTTVEDSLINERVINYDAFQILCINNDIDVYLIINNFFHLFQGDKSREPLVKNIIAFNNNKITLLKPDDMSDLISNKMEIKNLSKPLNSISYYKLGDLKEICDKSAWDTTKSYIFLIGFFITLPTWMWFYLSMKEKEISRK